VCACVASKADAPHCQSVACLAVLHFSTLSHKRRDSDVNRY